MTFELRGDRFKGVAVMKVCHFSCDSGKEKSHEHTQFFAVTARMGRGGGVSRPSGQGSECLGAVCGTQGT